MRESTPIWDEEFAGRWAELHPDDDTDATSYDVEDDDEPPVNPDCQAGKHAACAGDAWDEAMDERVDCECECHQRPVVDVVEAL